MAWVENFSSGLVPYSVVSGNAALYTIQPGPYGQTLVVGSQHTGVPAVIRRTVSMAEPARRVRFRYRVREARSDDSVVIQFRYAVTAETLYLVPRRELAYNAGLPTMGLAGVELSIGATVLPLNTWLSYNVELNPVGPSMVTITNEAGVVVAGQTFGPAPNRAVDQLLFHVDSAGPTNATDFADIQIAGPDGQFVDAVAEQAACHAWPAGSPQ